MKQENKGLRVKRKGRKSERKSKKVKRGSKVADSAQGEKGMNAVFMENMQGDNKRLREEIKGKRG